MAEFANSGVSTDSEIQGPLTDIVKTSWRVLAENVPRDLHWKSLLLVILIATVIYFVRNGHGSKGADGRERQVGLFQFLLPRDIYTHVSARVDVWLYVMERILRSV